MFVNEFPQVVVLMVTEVGGYVHVGTCKLPGQGLTGAHIQLLK